MRVLRSIVQPLVLPMLHALEHVVLGSFVALQLICHDHPWNEAVLLEEFAEESLRRLCIPMPLHQNVEYVAFRIHCSPQVILFAFERDDHLIEMPLIRYIGAFTSHLIGVLLSKLLGPFPN